jgi:hypothetical protein
MATYTSTQLSGTGSIGENLSGLKTFTFTNPSSSAYFTLETIPNASGFYSSQPTNAIGSWVASASMGFVSSSYIASVVVQPGISSLTFTPTSGNASSNGSLIFNGTTNYLSFAPGITVGSGAFTAETFVYISDYSEVRYVILAASTPGGSGFSFGILSVNQIFVDRDGVSSNSYQFASNFPSNTWFHIAVTRNSAGQETVFVNGVKSTSSYGTNVNYSGKTEAIGRFNESVWLMSGSLSQTRLVVGSNVYDPTSSTITVPTSPLTNVTNTQILLNVASSGTYINDTSGNQTLTNTSGVSFNSASPFASSSLVEGTTYRLKGTGAYSLVIS